MAADTLVWSATGAEIHQVVVGDFDNNVFVLRCTETGDAVLLDAANEHERLLDLCRALGVRRVLETHGHWDHIQAVPQLRDAGYAVAVTAEPGAGAHVVVAAEAAVGTGRVGSSKTRSTRASSREVSGVSGPWVLSLVVITAPRW